MNEIIISILMIAAIGLLLGLILSVVSKVMTVETGETAAMVRDALPGANCGACGFSGCNSYADALLKGECAANLCIPGGNNVSKILSEILGIKPQAVKEKVATVLCVGNADYASDKINYEGQESCISANQLFSGKKDCKYGCIGFGDCMNACPSDAITICNDIAVIDKQHCTGCASCVAACPKDIIKIIEKPKKTTVYCNNRDKGSITQRNCKIGCIGCKICEKNCPQKAIIISEFLAVVDSKKCTNCGKCVELCPKKVIC